MPASTGPSIDSIPAMACAFAAAWLLCFQAQSRIATHVPLTFTLGGAWLSAVGAVHELLCHFLGWQLLRNRQTLSKTSGLPSGIFASVVSGALFDGRAELLQLIVMSSAVTCCIVSGTRQPPCCPSQPGLAALGVCTVSTRSRFRRTPAGTRCAALKS
jgi:hypothetical protein